MTNTTDTGLGRDIEHCAANIVYQIGDLLYETLPPDIAHEHFVKARQATNDRTIAFAEKLIRRLAKEEYERGKADALNIAHEIFGEVDDFWDLIDRYEAALETPHE